MIESLIGGMMIAVPAVVISIMAYWRSERAAARAEIAQQLAGMCRYIPCMSIGKPPLPPDDKQQELAVLMERIALLEERLDKKDLLPGVEWK